MPKRYVLLIRHATRARTWKQAEPDQSMKGWDADYYFAPSDSEKPGFPTTLGLASALSDQLTVQLTSVEAVIHSQHKVARQTADIFAEVLRRGGLFNQQPESCDCLTPDSRLDEINATIVTGVLQTWVMYNEAEHNSAILLIGHQPQLTYIAKQLLLKSWSRNRFLKILCELGILNDSLLPANILPLGSSEVGCIELGNKPRLVWLMTEKSPELLTELKAKITSKYDVAKFFLGALVVGTGLTLTDSVWGLSDPIDKTIAGAGAFAALVSLGLTAATLFSYDRLMMPQNFWGGDQKDEKRPWLRRWLGGHYWSVNRPPSQVHVILFYEMVHVWTHLFIPAIVSAFAAVGLVVIARAHDSIRLQPEVWWLFPDGGEWRLVLALFLVALVAFFVGIMTFYLWKPRLGFDD